MASVVDSRVNMTHEERTASSPRDDGIHAVTLTRIKLANVNVRIITLRPADRKKGISVRTCHLQQLLLLQAPY